MTFGFTEDQNELRSTAARFLEEKSSSSTVRELMETEAGFDEGTWKQMADLGWFGDGDPRGVRRDRLRIRRSHRPHGGDGQAPPSGPVLVHGRPRLRTRSSMRARTTRRRSSCPASPTGPRARLSRSSSPRQVGDRLDRARRHRIRRQLDAHRLEVLRHRRRDREPSRSSPRRRRSDISLFIVDPDADGVTRTRSRHST